MRSSVPASLSRRLLDQHLLTGLACLFSCVAVSLTLAWHDQLIERIEIAVLAPLALLLVSASFVRRSLAVTSSIESQLEQVAGQGTVSAALLEPVWEPAAAAAGWNLLVDATRDQQRLVELETRLAGKAVSGDTQAARQALDALPDGVVLCDSQGSVVLANRMAGLLLGHSTEGIGVGQSWSERLLGAFSHDRERIEQKLWGFEGHQAWDVQRSNDLEGGVIAISRSPLLERHCSGATSVWIMRDVTKQRLAEQMRDQFVFTATHELRTPLTNLKAYAETLAAHDDIDVERQKEFCNIIHAEATRLSRFVDELLDVSRMEAGALTLSRHETDTLRLVNESLTHIRPQAEQKRLELEVSIPPKLPALLVDKDKIEACLVNLLGNAVKYTPEEGRVKFTVQADERHIHFEVQDTGIGIAKEELPKMFQKFFRSHDARVQEISGSGLGLAFTHEIARLHGGRVAVESELNCGSRFTLTLPLSTE
jgi:signal transduction histidine kinase